jgi:hypothetical protein
MRRAFLVIALIVAGLVLGTACILIQPLLAHSRFWPLVQAVLTPVPYIVGSAVGLLLLWAGVFGSPSTLRKFSGLASLLPPSMAMPLSRIGFVAAGLLVLAIVGFILFMHSLG